jgi:integrase/recombinase XerD
MVESSTMTVASALAPAEAPDEDDRLIALWLHGRSRHTARAYARDARRLRAFVARSLPAVRLGDVQAFADTLAHLAPATQARILSAVKSLLAFGHRLGYLPYDVGRPVRLPTIKLTLAERILAEPDLHRLLALEPHPRNRVLLKLLYAAGLRVSEICALTWRDLQPRDVGGQVTVYGKGGKTRAILLPPGIWRDLTELGGEADGTAPLFPSRKKAGHLSAVQVWRIVRAAARRAGIEQSVSPHWLRHAHASHALDRGAPPHLVQATLGHASLATTSRYAHARPTDSSARYLAV